MTLFWTLFLIICLDTISFEVSGAGNRCFKCRSRGELGSCKDPFTYTNITSVNMAGVSMVPCATGWCGKVLEGGANSFKDEEYGAATERTCLTRPPSDSEERCAPTDKGGTKVMMCFCRGDLCNAAVSTHGISANLLLLIVVPIILPLTLR